MKTLFALLKETVACWSAHNAQKMGAALAYYTALSLAPLVIMIVGAAGLDEQATPVLYDSFDGQNGAMLAWLLEYRLTRAR